MLLLRTDKNSWHIMCEFVDNFIELRLNYVNVILIINGMTCRSDFSLGITLSPQVTTISLVCEIHYTLLWRQHFQMAIVKIFIDKTVNQVWTLDHHHTLLVRASVFWFKSKYFLRSKLWRKLYYYITFTEVFKGYKSLGK